MSNFIMKKKLVLLLLVFAHGVLHAQTWQDTTVLVEKIFEKYKQTNPGCQLAISRHGKIVFSRAWGMANMEQQVPLTRESVIEAGSVSKQFTAAAILLLEQAGKLSLNDNVRKYIPELPDYGTPITLRHLMQHTSGIKDWGSLMALSDWPRGSKTYSNNDVLYLLSHQRTLNHQPGDEFLYSNSNYVLFSIIVERLSKMNLAEFTKINIFDPAGMKHTQWRNSLNKVVPNRATAYGKEGNIYFTDMPNETVYGNGGLLTTAEDLLAWNHYYLSGKLGNPSLLPKQLSKTALNSGRMNKYSAGLRIDSINGWNVIFHDGATAGYRANLEYYPELDLSIAWLANTSEFDGSPDGTAELRNLLVKTKSSGYQSQKNEFMMGSSRIEVPPIVKPQALNDYVGDYYSDEVEAKLKITVTDGKLIIHRYSNVDYTLIPVYKDAFKIQNSSVIVHFNRIKNNKVSNLKFTTARVRNVLFKKQ